MILDLGLHWCALSFFEGCVEWIFVDESHTKSPTLYSCYDQMIRLFQNLSHDYFT
jgi:hypothetical protein